MKTVLVLAGILAVCAPTASAQETQQAQGSLRLLATTAAPTETPAPPAAPAAAAPPARLETPIAAPPPPAPAEPATLAAAVTPGAPAPPKPPSAPAAIGWTGAANFSPVAIVDLISSVCAPAVAGDGGDLEAHALAMGLGAPQPAPDDLARALPPGAVTWKVPAVDGVLYLVGFGENHMNCGAAVVRPMPEEGFRKVMELLKAPGRGFVQESTQLLKGDVNWVRTKSPKGHFVDVMEYPVSGDLPGVLRADFLPG